MPTSPKVNSVRKNNIKIIGDNVLYNNGVITAFYILPMANYSTASASGVEDTVSSLKNMFVNLTTNYPTLTFTIEKIDKIIKPRDVKRNLLDTISIYRPDFDMPYEFTKNINEDIQSYCMLGIDIQQNTLTDVEDLTIKDTIKALFKQAANNFAGLGNMKIDPEAIIKIEENIYRTINNKCARASKDLVFYNFVSKLYPTYDVSYDKLSYINENTYEDIMCSVTQTVSDNFGWFELHNEGVEVFGLPSQTTYGCMLDVKSFPAVIDTINFPMDYPNTVTTVQCMKKEDATIKLKRTRSTDRYEIDQALEAGAEEEALEATATNVQIATMAIEGIEAGDVICQFNTSILVEAQTREDLKAKVMQIITACKDRNILISKSLTQALDFLNNYVSLKPKSYEHMASLEFPLSFQQNSGATVGDTFDKPGDLWSPAIGEDGGTLIT